MREVSPAEVERQIRREGARHGLFPVMADDRSCCHVGQRERFLVEGPVMSAIVEKITPICSVTMQAPLSNVWKSRVQRHEWSRTKVYREALARRKAAERAVLEQNHRDRVRELARLQRIYGKGDLMEAARLAFRHKLARGGA
jgi:hypothetical protein